MSSSNKEFGFINGRPVSSTETGKSPTKTQTEFMKALVARNYAAQNQRPTIEVPEQGKSTPGLDSTIQELEAWPTRPSELNCSPQTWIINQPNNSLK